MRPTRRDLLGTALFGGLAAAGGAAGWPLPVRAEARVPGAGADGFAAVLERWLSLDRAVEAPLREMAADGSDAAQLLLAWEARLRGAMPDGALLPGDALARALALAGLEVPTDATLALLRTSGERRAHAAALRLRLEGDPGFVAARLARLELHPYPEQFLILQAAIRADDPALRRDGARRVVAGLGAGEIAAVAGYGLWLDGRGRLPEADHRALTYRGGMLRGNFDRWPGEVRDDPLFAEAEFAYSVAIVNHSMTAPLRALCRAGGCRAKGTCTRTAWSATGGFRGIWATGSPFEALVPTPRWMGSARGLADFWRTHPARRTVGEWRGRDRCFDALMDRARDAAERETADG